MLTLGLESTCDETACAVVNDKNQICSNIVASQEIHAAYGGVVPELASRAHLQNLPVVVEAALRQAELTLKDIDLIAVTHTPGLIGSLSVGVHFAKGLSQGSGIPLIGVNHVEAHLYAAYMTAQDMHFPALGLVVSGAHTAMFFMDSPTSYKLIGKTRDDALGETFDKVGRFLQLPYPGGARLEKLALQGNASAYPFAPSKVPGYDFSFSGLKTAVLYAIKGNNSNHRTPFPELSETTKANIAASFQKAACATVAQKLSSVVQEFSCQSILVGGGVASNLYFQEMLKAACDTPVYVPSANLCSDNAAMVAGLGGRCFQNHVNTPCISPCARSHWESVWESSCSLP
ncbi:tRNA (adenosine(37)-N6)-threonylcarbamoyltransferase complex transferase subunit TsaD [Chlamydia pecorum]|uniref:tRNA (adenosine(37)-N6)-threonylcarbamoyltransferase complex transferase subunit TsaD n=1 Tax=Chlamydia pecorum TaxID=85991 RepID=UPI00388E7C67